jgi:hypothetical protein
MKLFRRCTGFVVDLFKGPGNHYWDLARILAFLAVIAEIGGQLWNVHLNPRRRGPRLERPATQAGGSVDAAHSMQRQSRQPAAQRSGGRMIGRFFRWLWRSAITGRFISRKEAEANPQTSIRERNTFRNTGWKQGARDEGDML